MPQAGQYSDAVDSVNRRIGKRWRHGRTITSSNGRRLHFPPVINARKREISPGYLSEEERVRIADLRRAGLGARAIAGELGRSPSTVSRELRRIRDPSSGQYRPFTAQRLAADRRARPRTGKLARDPELRAFVAERLGRRWSPEQICQALRDNFPGDPGRHVVHETIYQGCLPAPIWFGCDAYRTVARTRAGALTKMTMIDRRPAEAADRSEPGHWEGELITGALNRSAIGTLVERATRFTILLHLPGRHTAEEVRDAFLAALSQLPPQLRRSLTWDQGKEMALHHEIAGVLGMPVFFCQKASPWQRPSTPWAPRSPCRSATIPAQSSWA
jgi:IS30 family transposase